MSIKESIFKSYLLPTTGGYRGGKSLAEVPYSGKIHKLSSNENPMGPSPKALVALQNKIKGLNLYPERTDDEFRAALSDFYLGQLLPDQFLTGNSGVALLELISRAFLNEDSEVIMCNPAFQPYFMFPQKQGAVVKDIPLVGDDFLLDIKGILEAISDKTRILFLASPNNPSGSVIPKPQIDELLAKVPDHMVTVLDEVYYQFVDDPDYVTALPYVLEGKNVIAINSFSKAYGLAGLRVGYAYGTTKIINYVAQLRRPFMINSLSYAGAIGALSDSDHIERTVTNNYREKHFLYRALKNLGVHFWQTQSNFILFRSPVDPLALEEGMLKEGIMIRPSGGFGAPGCIRVSIGLREHNIAFIEVLSKIVP